MSVVNEHLSGKGYAPLPQSISNTDTEDEDEHLPNPMKTVHNGTEEITIQDSNLILENGRFYPLDETRNLANRARNGRSTLGYCSDDVPIMVVDGDGHDDLWKRRDMTPLRRFCLVISVLLCVATILIFLYVLPCENSMTCVPVPEPQPSLPWDISLEGVELHGPVSIVPGPQYSPRHRPRHNLIFLLRGQQYGNTNHSEVSKDGGAVLSLDGNNGNILWYVKRLQLPTDIDCTALDVNGSGKPDCLVVDEQGLLISIDPIVGTIYWNTEVYREVHTYSKLPVLLPDINADGINDLLSVENKDGQKKAFVLLSGKTGKLLGRHEPAGCLSIQIQNLYSNGTVSYFCHVSNGKESVKSITLKELLEKVNSILSFKAKTISKSVILSNHDLEDFSWKLTASHRLTIQNRGVCPGEQCQASINLTLQNGPNSSRLIWNHTAPNSYAMEPANMTTTGEPYITGFVIKFWQWAMAEPASQPGGLYGSLLQQRVTETVLVVLMNHTEVHALNASQSEVLQLCKDANCQPSRQLQTRSVAIADLNGDGSRELISYRTTYESAQLKSTVQVVKLDAEVAKLTQHDLE